MATEGQQARVPRSQLSPQQLYALQLMHEELGRQVGPKMTEFLSGTLKLTVSQLEQIRLTEHLFSCTHPTCMQILEPEGLPGKWLLDVTPQLAYPLINCMLGGSPNQDIVPSRAISDFEWRVLSSLTECLVAEAAQLWSEFGVSGMEVVDCVTNPQLAQITAPTAAIIVVHMRLAYSEGPTEGQLSFGIPYESIVDCCPAILNKYLNSNLQSVASAGRPSQALLADTKVTVNLARSTISAADLMNLQIGDIVTTEQVVSDDLEVEVDGVGTLRARAGAMRGKKAIEITQTMAECAEDEDVATAEESAREDSRGSVAEQQSVGEIGGEAA